MGIRVVNVNCIATAENWSDTHSIGVPIQKNINKDP